MARNGFTLIELLVVIAIVGILSSVVLTSLNDSRSKAANSAIKSNLGNIRVYAELYYDTNTSYGNYPLGVCPSSGSGSMFHDPTILAAINSANNASGNSNGSRCAIIDFAWAISIPLKKSEGAFNHWCVDSKASLKGKTDAIISTSC
ncbi:MAG: hypothetical protein A2653_00345 [Candidatus Zambryskibacteria bacterium RIFCSPHIGHO2_01_FULL_43_25]|uniref:Type II secretion system protein GspG C-terminal domain-containing protein n=1 Tax=Candidatus Zambryskibacteria bacterium RIFCSPLOWO2_01_FULL_45_21 TaxID=1802761 RepID=A0A1G2U4S3_9BACT|nr:MAG: hypothetical protein A2653_00345 [Candidatus Zambryskibacteria bacterium RIFCSPHIGHO2_01_FULL_43_25]OHB00678.1 MAG: hypothetical protein A3E94_03600 [Candidatus Zambryskibacteria bacterium RIFCSPHIGHO2_12_FULL_44_12b]OHB04494.1 MAG: hypothetical protein A3B14_03640 [Candidatus Zambryskibacteria bacterium RIFCSPLOWO2_01_FULL_45_21]